MSFHPVHVHVWCIERNQFEAFLSERFVVLINFSICFVCTIRRQALKRREKKNKQAMGGINIVNIGIQPRAAFRGKHGEEDKREGNQMPFNKNNRSRPPFAHCGACFRLLQLLGRSAGKRYPCFPADNETLGSCECAFRSKH